MGMDRSVWTCSRLWICWRCGITGLAHLTTLVGFPGPRYTQVTRSVGKNICLASYLGPESSDSHALPCSGAVFSQMSPT